MIIDFFMKQPPGKYLLLKDPYQVFLSSSFKFVISHLTQTHEI